MAMPSYHDTVSVLPISLVGAMLSFISATSHPLSYYLFHPQASPHTVQFLPATI